MNKYMNGYIRPSDSSTTMYPSQNKLSDEEYFFSLLPKEARQIYEIISDELDRYEYEGSIIFHEYPDKEYLNLILTVVIERIRQLPFSSSEIMSTPTDITWDNNNEDDYTPYDDILESLQTTCVPSSCSKTDTYSIAEVPQSVDYLVQLVAVIFYNNIMTRRNRYFHHKEHYSNNQNLTTEMQDKY